MDPTIPTDTQQPIIEPPPMTFPPPEVGNTGPAMPKKHLFVMLCISLLILADIIIGGVIVHNVMSSQNNKNASTPAGKSANPTKADTVISPTTTASKKIPTATSIPKPTATPFPTMTPTPTPIPKDTTPPELIDFVGITAGGTIGSSPGQSGCYPIRIKDNVSPFSALESRMRMDLTEWSGWDHQHEKCYVGSPGQHTIYAEIRDEAGNIGTYSRTFNIEYPQQ